MISCFLVMLLGIIVIGIGNVLDCFDNWVISGFGFFLLVLVLRIRMLIFGLDWI